LGVHFFFFQAEDGIRDRNVTGVQTCALPIWTITAIAPTSGAIAGGTSVTITGTNINSGTTVSIGGAAATSVNVVNATTLTATTRSEERRVGKECRSRWMTCV